MKINRGALIFGGVAIAAILVVAVGVWVVSLFGTPAPGTKTNSASNFFSALFPFGNNLPRPSTTGENGNADNGQTGPAPALREISHAPTGGAHFQSSGAVRYIEKETGHVYETMPGLLAVTRISNTTIPGIQNAVWLGDSAFVLQYLDENKQIKNYLANLASSTPDQAIVGSFLSNFTDVFPSADEKHLIEGVRSANGITVLASDTAEKTKKTLFTSPLRSWTVLPAGSALFIESAPSEGTGFLYKVNVDRSLSKIAGDALGLMAVPNKDGTWIAYSVISPTGVSLFIFDTVKKTTTVSPIGTLAEKCAWLPEDSPRLFCGVPSSVSGISPDLWFMGMQSYSDSAWIIDPQRGTARIVRDLEKDAGRPIDIIKPSVSPDGMYAMFTNKNDLSLWSLSLTK